MRTFNAWAVAMLLFHINERRDLVRKMNEMGHNSGKIGKADLEAFFQSVLIHAELHARDYGLQSTLDRVWDNGPFRMAVKTESITWVQMGEELRVLRECIEADLSKHTFAFVHPAKASILESLSVSPWDEIRKEFPKAEADILSAGECFAFEQNTACVFHLSRVAEYGLREVAKSVGVKLIDKGKPMPIEYATWDKVISSINSKITSARLLPHGATKARRLQFFSNAGENCSYLKDLWRNDVAHARKDYNEGEANGVFIRVRDFMYMLCQK
jgi:hypothetical protein